MKDESRQKQLDIVLKLNKLTKQGKIKWNMSSRTTFDTEEGGLMATLAFFEAEYKGRTFRVEEISEGPVQSLQRSLLQVKKPEGSFRLVVSDPDESSNIIIPPIPAIDDLAQTIRRTYEEGKIEELEELDRLLEEDL